ncbi:unnamed protein product [Amoebophrya sp. A120]|nr:unnamed protein product [Amoebophrya sp. A120]|eukprot:GSA120T00023495001.1
MPVPGSPDLSPTPRPASAAQPVTLRRRTSSILAAHFRLRPSEKVCCMSIQQAARTICLYFCLNGFLTLLTLITVGPPSRMVYHANKDLYPKGDSTLTKVEQGRIRNKNDPDNVSPFSNTDQQEQLQSELHSISATQPHGNLRGSAASTKNSALGTAIRGSGANNAPNTAGASDLPDENHTSGGRWVHLSTVTTFLQQLDLLFRGMSLWIGVRGYTGFTLRFLPNMQVCIWFAMTYCLLPLLRYARAFVICDETPEIECKTLRGLFFAVTTIELGFHAFLVYVLWSAKEIAILQGAPEFHLEGEQARAAVGMQTLLAARGSSNLFAPVATTAGNSSEGSSGANNANSSTSPGTNNRPVPASFEPFAGQGYRLE